MNKSELVALAATKASLSQDNTRKVVDAIIGAVSDALKAGDRVQLVGFGTFKVAERAARQGKNPITGEVIQIPAKKVPAFSAGTELKNAVNK